MMRRQRNRGFTLMELMIVLAIIGLLSAIAVPSMFRMQARSRQSEAKINLRGYFSAVKSHYAETSRFTCDFCDWEVAEGYRYNYYITNTLGLEKGENGCDPSAAQLATAAQTNADRDSGTLGGFTAGAAGNIDNDTYCDGWNINDSNDLWSTQDDVTGGP